MEEAITFNINQFINQYVVKRSRSMFLPDIKINEEMLVTAINGKSILVIGGAGSIGSSFIKAILPFRPAKLIVVDINENALTELTRDLRSTKGMYIPDDYMTYPMDYASKVFEKMFISQGGFNIVANFSAHKHVRSEKDIFSVEALLTNNVLHAKGLLDLLEQYPPETYFCVSTDKAANPVNIMGASKRIMEDLIFSYSDKFPVKTARFANVAFSNGSLPAGFLRRMEKQQPLSAPIDVKRYFVTLEESGEICMLACMLGKNREIFFPKFDLAQMMKFDAIVINLLHECGYKALICSSEEEAIEKSADIKKGNKQYPVYFSVSDTSGEKDHEEFYTENEITDMNRFISLGVITGKEKLDRGKIMSLLKRLEMGFEKNDVSKEEIINIIGSYLDNFRHMETGKSLDSKM